MISFLGCNYTNMITYYLLIAINFLKKFIGKNYLKSGSLVQCSKINQICGFFRTSACPRALAPQGVSWREIRPDPTSSTLLLRTAETVLAKNSREPSYFSQLYGFGILWKNRLKRCGRVVYDHTVGLRLP